MSDSIKRYYRKHIEFFTLLEKIKLWPSKTGALHGISSIKIRGDYAEITTHCGECFRTYNSKSSRAARWLRNKWFITACDKCKIPAWKVEKYKTTAFSQHYGTDLRHQGQRQDY